MTPQLVPKVRRWVGLKRRIAGWILLLLAIVTAGCWVLSGWYDASGFGYTYVIISNGTIETTTPNMFGGLGISTFDPEAWSLDESWVRNAHYRWRASLDAWQIPPPNDWWVYCSITVPGSSSSTQPGAVTTVRSFAFWPVPLVLGTPGVLLLRSGGIALRRSKKGMCIRCGYPRAGLSPGAPCPECGPDRPREG